MLQAEESYTARPSSLQSNDSNQLCKIIVISGRPATGKTTICNALVPLLKQRFPSHNILFLDTNTLLSMNEYIPPQHIETIQKLKNSGKLKYHLDPEIMSTILNSYFSQHNTSQNIILFYRGPSSVHVCKHLNFVPNLYIYLDAPTDDLIHRVCLRRVDLRTGKTYHLEADAAFIEANQHTLQLSQRIGDSEDLFRARIDRSDRHVLEVFHYYQNMGMKGATNDSHLAATCVECGKEKGKEQVLHEVFTILLEWLQ
ncbi:hypothetical protein FDP41_000536 [Naegleria fowleri]|uniref:Phosphoribulokinase/uridine kinase domain-containing protein n=1 Tax=Naegleria fowleri TaxID=5763 RepID=A0A6A5C5S6_NAEFO|nr:uncharacterized protein FDP41_000536 [Naegleria fowleri]KAF0984637.1 hypothetical protein FDP41_000536 [Naegleria fowleri]